LVGIRSGSPHSAPYAARWEAFESTPGTTVAVGGAMSSPAIYKAIKAATCRVDHCPDKPKVAVLLSSKSSDAAAHEAFYDDPPSLEETWSSMGFEPVFIPVTVQSREKANDPEIAKLVRSCDAVYLAGGDQAKHVRALLTASGEDTPLMKAIREVRAKGGVVSGSSAGAAAQGAVQYGEGDVYHYLVKDQLARAPISSGTLHVSSDPDLGSLQAGLGLLGHLGAIVCTHFDARARLGRLLVAMKETDESRGGASGADRALGIGLDEDTALFVKGSVGRVHGKGGVFIADASQATFGKGPHFSVKGMRIHYLRAGDEFDFASRKIVSKKPLTGTKPDALSAYSSSDLLRKYEMTKLIESLVETGAAKTTGATYESSPRFTFSLSRDVKTRAFLDDEGQVAIESLKLDVDYST
jgi:cyanophycinase